MSSKDEIEEFLQGNDTKGGGYGRHVEALRSELGALQRELATLRAQTATRASVPATHLVIGDSHSDPEVPNDRYQWLGRMVADLGPDVVIDIGDWADMGSLSHFDYGKRSYEGRRYWRDVEQAVRARETFNSALGGVRPRLIHCRGNHEQRIEKLIDDDPRLHGFISTDDLQVKELGWEEFNFMVPAVVDGIAYAHYFPSGVNGKAVGGMNLASSLIRLGLMSCVQGHSHTFDYTERTRADGQKVLGMSVGCYFKHLMKWSTTNHMYWRGIVVIRNVRDGFGTIEQYSMEAIEAKYGGT